MEYIIDTNVVSYYIWGKILGVDKGSYDKLVITCSKMSNKLYRCTIKSQNRIIKEVNLLEGEVESLKYTADGYKNYGDYYEIVFDKKTIHRLKSAINKVKEICSKNSCYVPPELPVAFKDGSIKDVFKLSLRNKIVYAPEEVEFNKKLKEFFKETKAKVLLDNDLLNKLNDKARIYLVDNIKRVVGKDYIYKDDNNKFYPVIKISDGLNNIVYDSKNKVLVINGKVVKLDEQTLRKHPALENILKVLEESPYDVNKIHEALKTLYRSKIINFKLEKIKEYEPAKSYIDSYLITVAHDNVKILTADKGLEVGFSSSIVPIDKENIEVIS